MVPQDHGKTSHGGFKAANHEQTRELIPSRLKGTVLGGEFLFIRQFFC
jgi:hypothetical protein